MASTSTHSLSARGQAFNRPENKYLEHKIAVVCDATPSAVPDCPIPASHDTGAGEIGAVSVVLPESAYPNTIPITIKDGNGVTIFSSTVTGSASLKKRLLLTDGENEGRISFVGPLTVSQAGNTTASATWSLYILVY